MLGVDIGITGALALLGDGQATVYDMPTLGERGRRAYDVAAIARLLGELGPEVAVLEDVHAMPGQGVASTFTLGYGAGLLLGLLRGMGTPVELVSPRAWKRDLGLGKDKRQSLELARQLFPHLADRLQRGRDHNRAEALLLAHWYLRKNIDQLIS